MRSFRTILLILLAIFSACSPTPTGDLGFSPPVQTSIEVPLTTPSLQFFSFGDWGSGDANQKAVAQTLEKFCSQVGPCDFGVLLGDNFYDFGVTSVTDPLWQERFEKMYAGLDLPFYVALGNHDHLGNPQAQIDYTYLPDQTRWKMPARQFTVTYTQPGANPLLEIFVLDSQTFSAEDAAQLEDDINASQARWKIMAFHHPIYSDGDHGNTPFLIDFLLPIICGKVDVVLVGHDHLFTHLFDPDDGCNIQHFVVGTGGKTIYASHPDSRVLFTLSDFGFATLEVGLDKIHLEFHKTDDTVVYQFDLLK